MALPLALLALIVMGALVAGGFSAALLEQRLGRNTLYALQAQSAAEAGVAAVMNGWEGYGLELLAPGDSATLPASSLPGLAAYSPTVSRLNAALFLVRVTGVRGDAAGGELARREVGLLVRTADSAAAASPPVEALTHRAWTGAF